MTRIGLISDTHGWLDERVFDYFSECDVVWHLGDIGNLGIADQLSAFRPFRAVYGNIDTPDIRHLYPEKQRFYCEEVEVLMIHIGGYPGKYTAAVKKEMDIRPPGLMLCGHSHILKVIYDPVYQCLHINPGAAGRQGWHKKRTLVRLTIDGKQMRDCQIIELGVR